MAEQKEIRLTDHQNLYDQPPFEDIIVETNKRVPQLEIPGIRMHLSEFVLGTVRNNSTYRKFHIENYADAFPDPSTLQRAAVSVPIPTPQMRRHGYRSTFNTEARKAGLILIDQLIAYPYWMFYLYHHLAGSQVSSFYLRDGSLNISNSFVKEKSAVYYLSFMLKHISAEQKSKYWGLQELLPVLQTELVTPDGARRVALAWRDKIAANLTPEKR